jgi:hypothetical protein
MPYVTMFQDSPHRLWLYQGTASSGGAVRKVTNPTSWESRACCHAK